MQGDTTASAGSVSELLGSDHRRLDAILAEVKRALAAGDLAGAAARFSAFREGLERHIVAEEQVLFPTFERATGLSGGGPTQVMRAEHAELRRLLDELAASLARSSDDERTSLLGVLTGLIRAHNGKEERILYPMTDQALRDAPEREEVLRRLREP
jgi:hemerythrin-like domain-containing protein